MGICRGFYKNEHVSLLPAVDEDNIRIIPGLTYQGGNRLYSRHAAVPLKSLLFSLVASGGERPLSSSSSSSQKRFQLEAWAEQVVEKLNMTKSLTNFIEDGV